MLNTVVLIGRLTADPKLRYTPGGHAVANFSLAVERPYKNQAGEKEVDFFDIVVWRKLAETCDNHLGKGRLVAISGSLQQDRWETDEGKRSRVKVNADNVRFLDWPKDSNASEGNAYADQDEDELPF